MAPMSILDFDPVEQLAQSLAADRRPPDGKLHPSGDLTGSLRHAMLTAAGAPTVESDVVSDTRLILGTLLHRWLEGQFRSRPVMNEVKLDRWMPEGWSGTADAFFWNSERRAFALADYKSIKPEGIAWIHRDGVKDSHLWQTSAYWWAAARMGIPLIHGAGIFYLPTQQLLKRDGFVTPTWQELTPLPQEVVEGRMAERWALTKAYLHSLGRSHVSEPPVPSVARAGYLTDALAPVQDRVVKLTLNKQLKVPVINVSLVPHWSTDYCPFPNELCDCREQKANKIGHWQLGEPGVSAAYVPRKDMPQPNPIPKPTDKQFRDLVAAMKEKDDS